jgi:hypothetical protein
MNTIEASITPEKPPIGLMPEVIFEGNRLYERIVQIQEAIARYADAGKPIPPEWAEELGRRITNYHLTMGCSPIPIC